MDALIGILLIAAFAGLLVGSEFAPPMIFRYSVENAGVRVRLFGVSITHVPFEQITAIERKSWLSMLIEGALPEARWLGGWLFRKAVVIWRADRGPLMIAPRAPDTFVAEVERHLAGRLTSA